MENITTPELHSSKLLDRVCERIRVKHYSIRTKTQFVQLYKVGNDFLPTLYRWVKSLPSTWLQSEIRS